MADEELAAELAKMEEKLTDSSNQLCRVLPDWDERGDEALEAIEGIAKRALAAVDAVLAGHPLTATVRYAVPCDAHAYTAIGARRGCPKCVKVEYHDGCRECSDEFGSPVRPEDCRARKAILAGLTGKPADGG